MGAIVCWTTMAYLSKSNQEGPLSFGRALFTSCNSERDVLACLPRVLVNTHVNSRLRLWYIFYGQEVRLGYSYMCGVYNGSTLG